MTFSESLYASLSKAREEGNGVIPKLAWLAIVQSNFEAAVGEAVKAETASFSLEGPKKSSTRKPKGPRPRNPLFDALALATGTKNLEEITRNAGKEIGVALADILAVCPDLTVEEIYRRAALYRAKWRESAITPLALAKRWGEFGGDHTRVARRDRYVEPDKAWRMVARRLFPNSGDWVTPIDWDTVPWAEIRGSVLAEKILAEIPYEKEV